MSLIDKICKTCKHRRQPALEAPCCLCTDKDMWEVAETVTVSSEKLETLQQENKQLREALEEAAETIENMYGTETKQTEKYRVLIDEVMKG